MFASLPFLLLGQDNHIRKSVNNLFYRNNIKPNIFQEADDVEILCAMSEQSLGVAFFPELLVMAKAGLFQPRGEDTLYAFPLEDRSTDCQLVIGYHRDRYLSGVAKAFITMLEEECLMSDYELGGNPQRRSG